MRQSFVVPFVQLLKHWLYDVRSSIVVENWAHSVDQCWLQALRFLVHLINFLSILLRCNGFSWIQKAVVDRWAADHQTVTITTFLVQVWPWQVLWSFFLVHPLRWLLLVVI